MGFKVLSSQSCAIQLLMRASEFIADTRYHDYHAAFDVQPANSIYIVRCCLLRCHRPTFQSAASMIIRDPRLAGLLAASASRRFRSAAFRTRYDRATCMTHTQPLYCRQTKERHTQVQHSVSRPGSKAEHTKETPKWSTVSTSCRFYPTGFTLCVPCLHVSLEQQNPS